MRSGLARWIVAILVIPVLVLGVFDRVTFLWHGHDGHGVHLHALSASEGGHVAVANHIVDTCHDRSGVPDHISIDHESSGVERAELPDGVIITVDVPETLPSRGGDLTKALNPTVVFTFAVFVLPASREIGLHIGSPGGRVSSQMDLFALSANDRLVRTSRALLI